MGRPVPTRPICHSIIAGIPSSNVQNSSPPEEQKTDDVAPEAPLVNDLGHAVEAKQVRLVRNPQGVPTYLPEAEAVTMFYCGKPLEANEDPDKCSDGNCGPDNGPQCQSCARLQELHGKKDNMTMLSYICLSTRYKK